MWQVLAVGLIVLVASTYAVWALVPGGTRLRLASRFAVWSARSAQPAWIVRLAAALERSARTHLGGCSDCRAAGPPSAASRSRATPEREMSGDGKGTPR